MRSFPRVAAGLLLALSSMLVVPPSVHGSGSRLGASFTAVSTYTRGSAVAFDTKNGVYLVVSSNGPLNGRFVKADGTLVGTTHFVIHGVGFTHYPQAAFSPDANGGAGGFLVSWHQTQAVGATPQVRTVSYNGTDTPVLGPVAELTTDGSWWEASAPIAYSTTSKEFLVTWQAAGIRAHRVGNSGEKLGTMIYVTNTTGYFRDPSIAYNPTNNQFLVSYGGADNSGAFAAAMRFAAGTGTPVGAEIPLHRAGSVYITEASYNSLANQYLVAWWQPGGAFGKLIDASGNVLSSVLPLSTRFSAYDALGIDFNPRSGTYMLVSHDQFSYQNGAVEINASGVPDGVGFVATEMAATRGNFYPQLAANPNQPQWLLATSTDFLSTTAQRLQSDSSGVTTPPPAATLVSPSGQIGTSTPTFTWNAASGASHYYLWVTDATKTTRIQQWYEGSAIGCPAAGGTCSVSPGIALASGTAYWWVQTWNLAGYGPWSAGSTFKVVAPPAAATLVTPSGMVGRNPIYRWNAVPGATHYYLWVVDSSGVRVQQWYNAATVGCVHGTGMCAVDAGTGLAAGGGTWWVQTWNGDGYGPWSAGVPFTVTDVPAPNLLSATLLSKPTVQYQWNAVTGATHYYLWVTDSQGVARIQRWYTAIETGCSTANICTIQAAEAAMANGTARFWIQAWHPGAGFSPWSVALLFNY
jgi:hypothetical protein